MICRKAHVILPDANPLLPEHKNADFVLGGGKNLRKIARSDTKKPFLYSKSPKMGVSEGKSAQKRRFCARKGRLARQGYHCAIMNDYLAPENDYHVLVKGYHAPGNVIL